jgi:hypothetical protein
VCTNLSAAVPLTGRMWSSCDASSSNTPCGSRLRPDARFRDYAPKRLASSHQLGRRSRWHIFAASLLAHELVDAFGIHQAKQTQVVSLHRATASDLVLSEVGLEECAFARAHGLDKLRIDATCSFQRPPAWLRSTWRPFTGRRVIFEEVQ